MGLATQKKTMVFSLAQEKWTCPDMSMNSSTSSSLRFTNIWAVHKAPGSSRKQKTPPTKSTGGIILHTKNNQPTNQPTNQPNNQTTKQPNNQTTKQPNNQTTNQPTKQTNKHCNKRKCWVPRTSFTPLMSKPRASKKSQKNLIRKSVEIFLLVVSTHLKNISQIGSFPQVGMKIKNIWNHHLVFLGIPNHLHSSYWDVPGPRKWGGSMVRDRINGLVISPIQK